MLAAILHRLGGAPIVEVAGKNRAVGERVVIVIAPLPGTDGKSRRVLGQFALPNDHPPVRMSVWETAWMSGRAADQQQSAKIDPHGAPCQMFVTSRRSATS
jgi:hypothetical protein